ncbi:MAG TPA: ISL3 family transposase [Ktedonobacteraceae bacterium]|jgi:transposase
MTVPVLLPDPTCLHLRYLDVSETLITAVVATTSAEALCPLCQHPCERIHSRYVRMLADLPWMGCAVHLELHVRRFFCDNLECERQIFAERLPRVVAHYARRTLRLTEVLTLIGFALGGEAGKRLAADIGMACSPDTLLRLLQATPEKEYPTPKILGVDDWSWRRGHTYGTILIDLERHLPVDLLPDREAETLANWLQNHPGVQIVSRDRGGNYAEGVRKGAPGAIQVADRFHLLKNLSEAVQDLLTRHLLAFRRELAANASQTMSQKEGASPPIKLPVNVTPKLAAIREAREEERFTRYEQIIALREQGWSHQAIADHLGMGHSTVQRWVKEEHFPKRKAREQSSQLDPFLPYIRQRRTQGCYNMVQLHHELRERGYQGSYDGMRHILLRFFPKERKWQRTPVVKKEDLGFPLSAHEAMWLFLRQPEQLTEKERQLLEQLCQIHEEVGLAYQLVQQFARMARDRQGGQLDAWLEKVAQSPLKDLHPFVRGIRSDIEAVEAGLILPWSNGQTEGQITRLKLLKRLGYGRANFQTLRKRVLYRAS